MFPALLLALGDLFDCRVLAVLARSLAITIAIFVGIALVLVWALTGADPCGWIDGLAPCPLDGTTGAIGGIVVAVVATWLLFPAVAIGVLATLAEKIVTAVEARHYPESLVSARPLGQTGLALLGLRSGARLLLANVVALPFYLLLLATGVGPVVLFVLVTGWAAGRDFGEMVAFRHGGREARRRWLRASGGERAAVGVVCACLFLIPFLNLLAPVVGAAAVTHLYHRRRAAGPPS